MGERVMNSATWYWITVTAGLVLSAVFFIVRGRRRGISFFRMGAGYAVGLILGWILARLICFLLFPSSGDQSLTERWICFTPDAYSFASGGIGFCLGNLLPDLRDQKRRSMVADALALPACMLAAFFRFAEIFLDNIGLAELYKVGLPDIEEGSLLANFPFAVSDAWGMWYFSISTLSTLLILVIIILIAFRERRLAASGLEAEGMIMNRSAYLMCLIPFLLELARAQTLIFYFVHVEQVLCALVMIGLLIGLCRRRKTQTGRFPASPLILTVLCFSVNGITQYMMDRPWEFEGIIPEGLFIWINERLAGFSFSVFFVTTAALLAIWLVLENRYWKSRVKG